MNQDVEDDEEDDELGNDDLREVYKQRQNNMRAFIALRFRHFATFSLILASIATLAVGPLNGSEEKFAAGTLGLVMIFLFWILDFRTAEYLKHHARIALDIEYIYFGREKRVKFSNLSPPRPSFMSASSISNVIFTAIFIGWLGFMISFAE